MAGRLPSRWPKRRGRLPRSLGQIMALVAVCAVAVAVLRPRPAAPPRPGWGGFRTWRAPRAVPVPLAIPPAPDARPLRAAPAWLDEAMIVEAPEGIDDAMIVDPYARRARR